MSAVTPADTWSELGRATDLLVQFDALAGQFCHGLEGEHEWRDFKAAMTSMRAKCTAFREQRRKHHTPASDTMPAGWAVNDVHGTISIQSGFATKATLWLADGTPFRTWVTEQLVHALAQTAPPPESAA